MRFGICADLLNAPLAASAGYDYIEGRMTEVAGATDGEFERLAEAVEQSGIRAEALCVMLPGSFRLTGPEADLEPVREYLEKAFARSERLGVAVQGFGSSGARNCPGGWPESKALSQLAEFLGMAADIAAGHGIRIAVEALNRGECNIITSVAEASALAGLAGRRNVGVLADWFHMAVEGEGAGGMREAGSMLLHCHIANPAGRRFPLPQDGADYSVFADALKKMKYGGRLSIEAAGEPGEYAAALQRLKELF